MWRGRTSRSMVASVVSEMLVIQSHKGPYTVTLDDGPFIEPASLLEGTPHFLVDANIARLYDSRLGAILQHPHTIVIEATEPNKSLERTLPIFQRLVESSVRRDHTLVAIGGGIVQDITCFIASTLLRGVPWRFVPTTLLAQADSCIGSKSSINLGSAKNIVGTFNPPRDVFVDASFLDTLGKAELQSGIGEIIKVHAIDGVDSFNHLAVDFDRLLDDRAVLLRYIKAALLIKKRYIEVDEFDKGIRNIFNYGHSFGHAIESATGYAIPHGIAISIGMDLANHVAVSRGMLPAHHRDRMQVILRKNYKDVSHVSIPMSDMLNALGKDKKNTNTMLGLILAVGERAEIQRVEIPLDDRFRAECTQALGTILQ